MVNGSGAEESEMNMKEYGTQNTPSLFLGCNGWVESEKGIVLIVSLLLLLVATIIGVTALSTSTTSVMITGNQRLRELNFSTADAGVSISIPIIEGTVSDKYAGDPDITISPDFVKEIFGELRMSGDTALASPDIQFDLGTKVSIDVDYLYSGFPAGAAMEFASSYEGLGKGAGRGGVAIYYSINSLSEAAVSSQTEVSAVYRYITR